MSPRDILLLVPLKLMMVGLRWQFLLTVAVIVALLWAGWRFIRKLRLPVSWPFVLLYAGAVTAVSELTYFASKALDKAVPVHLEVLLPAFVLGCVLARPAGAHPPVVKAGVRSVES